MKYLINADLVHFNKLFRATAIVVAKDEEAAIAKYKRKIRSTLHMKCTEINIESLSWG
jgi:hypothetical protein|nr:MAG TPA: hypothetical protein [Crassvirales sp.]